MFWEIYSRLCMEKGLSANAVARMLSIASGTVTEWKKGRIPQNATLKRIAEYFGVSAEYLLGKETDKRSESAERAVRIPVYDDLAADGIVCTVFVSDLPDIPSFTERELDGNRISAGIPLRLIDEFDEYEEASAKELEKGEYVALRIRDERMSPRMMPGDVAIVRVQKDVSDGDVAVALVDGNTLLGRLKKNGNGILLLASNPDCEPILFTEQKLSDGTVRIFGRVVELRAKY